MNEISVIQNVNSNVNNRILSGYGNFAGAFPGGGGGDAVKTAEPGGNGTVGGSTAADTQQNMSPPSSNHHHHQQQQHHIGHHLRTPPLWDLHYDRQSSANIKSAGGGGGGAIVDDHVALGNNCAPQSPPQSSPMSNSHVIPQNRTEGLAT